MNTLVWDNLTEKLKKYKKYKDSCYNLKNKYGRIYH